jgi:sulfoxide reductase catalytic subunit YedY
MTVRNDIPASQITPPEVYFNRRNFIRVAVAAGSVAATGGIYRLLNPRPTVAEKTRDITGIVATTAPASSGFVAGEPKTPLDTITSYNNFYEFAVEKTEVHKLAKDFSTAGWMLSVGGMVRKPAVFGLEDLLKVAPVEERVYRMRCVERWSMVIPWDGYSLSKLLEKVEPLGGAKYVAFETLKDPSRFPGQRGSGVLPWPYVEGLRMDEAMHPLTMLTTGLYGKELPAQDGAPIRLITPWKYGFKGIKSIVKITLTAEMPPCTWNIANPPAYGFYANVNPTVAVPWDQSTEMRFNGTGGQDDVPTAMFNGYGDQVASLYAGMDLARDF